MTNHIPDIGKMVGDTPRTDAAWKPDGGDYFIVDVDLARQLERELNASTSEIARLTSKVAQLYEGAEELKQRIKRLEAAGDAMERLLPDGSICDKVANLWRTAKEAHP
jgi:predicted RNase H-like nuclease (RuvC/YqgF family)